MAHTSTSTTTTKAPGLVALGPADAAAARAQGIEAWELADAWSWLAAGEAGRIQARANGGLRPDHPVDAELIRWANGRTVVVGQVAGWSPQEREAMLTMAKALRVQTSATAVIHTIWGA